MTIAILVLLGSFVAMFSFPAVPKAEPCSKEWNESIERDYVRTSGHEGHGPDAGDSGWFYSVERGLRMQPLLSAGAKENCAAVTRQIENHRYIRSRLFGRLFRLY